MSPSRLSALFLLVAAVAGVIGLEVPAYVAGWSLPAPWPAALRVTCAGAILAFIVTFVVTLDRSALLRR